jgi:rod shape-determining protein MreC
MRNLRNFILKNYFFILFLLLQIASITLLVNSNNYHKRSFLNSSSTLVGYLLEKKAEVMEYIHLKDANRQLAEENARLTAKLKTSKFIIHKGQIVLKDSLYDQQFEFFPAKVISGTVNKRNNYFTLDRGSLDGVEKDMGVLTGSSILGFVKDVSPHYSTVITVLNDHFTQGVRMPINNEHGLIKWDGKDSRYVELTGIPLDATVRGGDSVVTSGASGRFPEGIYVGSIYSVSRREGSPHHHIMLKLKANLNATYDVLLVKNKFKKELDTLERVEAPK